MKLLLIRHGMTKGNAEKRYVGRTDEPVLAEEKQRLQKLSSALYGKADPAFLYASPMLRCLETAGILFPDKRPVIIDDLRECDFGRFEYKNWQELSADPDYQRFIDTNGEAPFPGGESKAAFSARCALAFERLAASWEECGNGQNASSDIPCVSAFVVHAGTIMAILEAFAAPHRDFYDWNIPNGAGFLAEWDPSAHRIINAEPLSL